MAMRGLRGAAATLALAAGALAACRAEMVGPDAARHFSAVTAPGQVTCGIKGEGDAWCWGAPLGNGSDSFSFVPVPVSGEHRFASIAAGVEHVCGVDDGGRILCWGANHAAQLGVVDSADFDQCLVQPGGVELCRVPTSPGDAGTYSTVVAGPYHNCALTTGGAARCWGRNEAGQLGVAPDTLCGRTGWYWFESCSAEPVAVPGGHVFTQISAGTAHNCGVTADGAAWCWGLNASGQLGDSTASDTVPVPVAVRGGHRFRQVAAGGGHSCGLTEDDELYCWGGNGAGTLGAGIDDSVSVTPVRVVGDRRWRNVAASGTRVCAVSERGQMYCWGAGRLGRADVQRSAVPLPVQGSTVFESVEEGAACGITRTMGAFCWGDGPPEILHGQW
jgi:alpha-tubulin suppressor-like RCC1 family protein